jgi:hypothetical protein
MCMRVGQCVGAWQRDSLRYQLGGINVGYSTPYFGNTNGRIQTSVIANTIKKLKAKITRRP